MKSKYLAGIIVLGVLQTFSLQAEQCEVKSGQDEFLLLQCSQGEYRAMSIKKFTQMKEENKNIRSELSRLKMQLIKTGNAAREVQDLSEEYRTLSVDYSQLNLKYKNTLDESVQLNENYSQKAENIISLTEEYDGLVTDYHKLTNKYRDIAMSGGSFISFDVGLGTTSNNGDTEAAALIGVKVSRLNVWGFLQQDNNGLLVGTSFGF